MDASLLKRCCRVIEVGEARAAPLDPDGISCAKVEMCVFPLRIKGACHEAYDYRIGFGKTSVPGAWG
jgi:hypothetical protein